MLLPGGTPLDDFYYDRKTLRAELLPEGWEREGTNFSYRVRSTRGDEYRNPFAPYLILTIGFAGLVALLVLRLLHDFTGIGAYAYAPQMLALVAALSLFEGLPSFLADARRSYWIGRSLIPVLAWVVLCAAVMPAWLLVPLVGLATACALDALAGNYLAWLLADPSTDYDTRELLRRRWAARWGRDAVMESLFALFRERKAARIFDGYLGALAAFSGGVAAATLAVVARPGLVEGLAAVVALYAWLALMGLIGPWWFRVRGVPLRLRLAVAVRAVGNWLDYNPRDVRAPGVYQSPYGGSRRRIAALAAVLAVLGIALNLVSSYFPVLMLGPSGSEPWAQQVAWRRAATEHDLRKYPWPQNVFMARVVRHGEVFAPLPEPAPESEADFERVLARLTPEQAVYYGELTDEAERRDYLTEVATAPPVPRPVQLAPDEEDYAALGRTPESWLFADFVGIWGGDARFATSLILSLVLGMAAPSLFLLLALWAVAGTDLALVEFRLTHPAWRQHPRDGEEPEESEAWYNPEWLGYVEAIQNSKNVAEREHLFLGFAQDFDSDDQYPVLFHRSLIGDHVYINGSSGSGKSSRGLAALSSQLVRFARVRGDCSILVLDVKGDEALFQGLRHESRGLPFRWYREQRGFSTFGFNPLLQSHIEQFNPSQKARAVMDAFGLRHGDALGERYFADVQEAVVRTLFEKHPNVRSLAQMHAILQSPDAHDQLCPDMPERDWDHAFHIREQLGAFARCAPLNDTSDDPARTIDLPSLFLEPQVAYFYVPALLGGGTNVQAAKFALYSLLTAALFVPKRERKQVYVIIDEFQEIIGVNVPVVLRQARTFSTALIVANQLPSDLDRGQVRMKMAVSGNVALEWSFRPGTTEQVEELQRASGEYLETLRSQTVTTQTDPTGQWLKGMTYSGKYTQSYRPTFNTNRLLWAGFKDDLSVAHFKQGHGFTQFFRPFALRTLFHVSEDLYRKRSEEPWPELPGGAGPTPSPGEPSAPRRAIELPGPARGESQRGEGDPSWTEGRARARRVSRASTRPRRAAEPDDPPQESCVPSSECVADEAPRHDDITYPGGNASRLDFQTPPRPTWPSADPARQDANGHAPEPSDAAEYGADAGDEDDGTDNDGPLGLPGH